MMTAEAAIAKCKELAEEARYTAPIDYAERLFKIKQLEHKRDKRMVLLKSKIVKVSTDERWMAEHAILDINTQISKLLEDE